MSLGSVSEVHSQLMLARDLGYVTQSQYNAAELQCETTLKLITRLIRSIRS
ncbi:four helix bundle protein [Candidatus Saccharibacteria bacterium]|nr:four helix bundle protein [Candidatus Saccharibacteria bacterium]